MIISRVTRKILKISAYFLGSIVVLALGFHFWFINHAEGLLEDLVESRSNGKLKLHVKKFKFNWFSYDMQLRNAVFYSADTSAATAYRFGVDRIDVRVREIFPLIFEKKILIDSLRLLRPDIQVTRLKEIKNEDTTARKEVSLSHEMGKVYNSIRDALEILQVSRFRVDRGKFTLINKIRTDQLPVSITNIDFFLDNLQVDSSTAAGKEKILFSDNVSLNTHKQDILFADGRHRLSFSHFHINILEKTVSFDSCTISAIKSDSTRTAFSVFFDKLQLTNIDFDTLYQKDVIKADSVYCINPQFKLDVELDKRKNQASPPRLDDLIQQLTGDLRLAFVIVNNGSFDISTMREGKPSSFTSDHNNFEMQGLNIVRNSPRHVSVKSFAMGIRNYENILRDSAFVVRFDSILFVNNSVHLSNFTFQQIEGDKVGNNFNMPQFELRGLSWDDLIFEKSLTAEKATLYYPVINYSVNKRQKQNIFQTLSEVGRIIQLDNLEMRHGQINIHFKGGTQVRLENTDMSLWSQDLVASKQMRGLQQSIRQLTFKKGFINTNNLTVQMENAAFTGENGKLAAGSVVLVDKVNKMRLSAKNIGIDSMMVNNNSTISEIRGMKWTEANIQINDLQANDPGRSRKFTITGINGKNTNLSIESKGKTLNTYLQSISADKISINEKGKAAIINLHANGEKFSFTDSTSSLTVGKFLLADRQQSEMENLHFTKYTATDSLNMQIPHLQLEPDLNSIINDNLVANNVKMEHPVIQIRKTGSSISSTTMNPKLPAVTLGSLLIERPEFSFIHKGENDTKIEWHGQAGNNFVELSNFSVKRGAAPVVETGQVAFAVNNLSVTTGNKMITTGTGSIRTKITGLFLEPSRTGELIWRGNLAELHLDNFVIDNLGKHSGRLEIKSALLNDLAIKSVSVLNFRQTLKENPSFRLKQTTGQYDNAVNHFEWNNLDYDKTTKMFSLDSFAFHPTASRDSFIAKHPYQTDYITIRTGEITAGPFEIDRYFTDTVINAGTLNLNDLSMQIYRDKRKPARENLVKPLPVNLIKKIPQLLSVDTAYMIRSNVVYEELNEKTNLAGKVVVNEMHGKIFPIVNYDIKPQDSLHLEMEGRLMDSISIAMKLKESYTDSVAGFLLTANIRPANAKLINPILIPLVSAKLESGFLDTLSMRVKGNEYVSIGEMQMYYHDLRIKLLQHGTEKKLPFLKSFANFLANNFIIKKSNRSRTGDIYFERIRNKSTMNYLVKITFSGIGSNIGLKKSKRLLRQYKKEKRKRNLPAIDYD